MLSGDVQYFIIDNIPLLWIVLLLDIEDRQPPTPAPGLRRPPDNAVLLNYQNLILKIQHLHLQFRCLLS